LPHSSDQRLVFPAILLACIGCLQPGIDPVFLTLLSSASGLSPEFHGWVVSATQTGMAAASLATWRWGSHFPQAGFVMAAGVAVLAALTTSQVAGFVPILLLRAGYGAAMGVLYTQAMSHAAVNRPHGAYGAVFLCQLMLSTVIALVLPAVSDIAGPSTALAVLALPPMAALALIAAAAPRTVRIQPHRFMPSGPEHHRTGSRAWASAAATLLFICATMMVWTFCGALAVDAGFSEDLIGRSVALGSLAGAATAFLVMREQPVVPPPIVGVLAGVSLLAPIAAARLGNPELFLIAIVAFNIGSTAIIVRTSGLASAASRDQLFRRFVACTHPLGMIMGPLTGSLATGLLGRPGLLVAAVSAITAGAVVLSIAEASTLRIYPRRRQESLDEFLTNVQS
jgi:hypothetical protein